MTDDQIEKMIMDIESKMGTIYAVYASKTILIEALKELQRYRAWDPKNQRSRYEQRRANAVKYETNN